MAEQLAFNMDCLAYRFVTCCRLLYFMCAIMYHAKGRKVILRPFFFAPKPYVSRGVLM